VSCDGEFCGQLPDLLLAVEEVPSDLENLLLLLLHTMHTQ
jgi:hypothetical protein